MSYKSLALVMTAIAGVSTSILMYLLAFRGQECRRLQVLSTESTNKQQRKGKSGRVDFRKILGKLPAAALDIPFPYDEQKVVKYIRQKLCPEAVPACSSPKSSSKSSSPLSFYAHTIHGDIKVLLDSNQTVTLDDIASGYTRAMEAFVSYSFTHFLGVPMQQGPKDAFAIMDLLWRVKPDLLIEFGTSGGGSAFFYGLIMSAYNPKAHVITMDPDRQEDWNKWAVKKICPHCVRARDTPFWKNSGVIEFIHDNPINVVEHVEDRIKQWGSKKIMIMDDSNHVLKNVLGNIMSYAHLVTKDSFIVVQDTKLSRPNPPFQPKRTQDKRFSENTPLEAVNYFLKFTDIGQDFVMDRRFEYYVSSEHAQGFLRRVHTNIKETSSRDLKLLSHRLNLTLLIKQQATE